MRIIDGVVIIYTGLLLNNLCLHTATRHSTAQEDIDQQHQTEQDAERHTQPGQPGGVGNATADGAQAGGTGGSRLRHVNRGRDGQRIGCLKQ